MEGNMLKLWQFVSRGLLGITICLIGAQNAGAQDIVNGLNTTALSGLIDNLKNDKDAGRVTFYSNSEWQDGMRSFTTFTGYKIDGKMYHENQRNFVMLGDEGLELSGTDAAAGAVEELMYAVGTCIIAAGNANAALMGVKLTKFQIEMESDLDLHGLFALDENVRPGILELRMKMTIAGDADDETHEKLLTSVTHIPRYLILFVKVSLRYLRSWS